MKAFIGMGLLGSNFVRAMLRKGHKVQVWNRTMSKAKGLEEAGAIVYGQVIDAVKGANRVHLALKDDVSVDEVLEQAAGSFQPGVIIIDHTTTTAQGAAERTLLWKSRGYTYVHAPVFMGPINALESTGTMMVSGDQELIELITPELAEMTGNVLNFGTDASKAAGIKLIGNLFLIAMTAGVADMLALSKALGINIDEVNTLFASWNPAGLLPMRLKKMTSGTYHQPSWELNMARKDAGLMMKEAERGGMPLAAIPAIAREMDQWIEKGFGNHDWTVIAKNATE